MLVELAQVRQIPEEGRRRWFSDPYFDLIVWFNEAGEISGFQLCYGKPLAERALTWNPGSGYLHHGVDDGETRTGRHKASPVLTADSAFDRDSIRDRFLKESTEIDPEVRQLVLDRLERFRANQNQPLDPAG